MLVASLYVGSFHFSEAQTSQSTAVPSSQATVQTVQAQLDEALRQLILLLQAELSLLQQQASNRVIITSSEPMVSVQPTVTPTPQVQQTTQPQTSQPLPLSHLCTSIAPVTCFAGYHQCSGSSCPYVSEIVSSPYKCVTNPDTAETVLVPAGAVWPVGECYNDPPDKIGSVSQSTDYFGCQLPTQCIED